MTNHPMSFRLKSRVGENLNNLRAEMKASETTLGPRAERTLAMAAALIAFEVEEAFKNLETTGAPAALKSLRRARNYLSHLEECGYELRLVKTRLKEEQA